MKFIKYVFIVCLGTLFLSSCTTVKDLEENENSFEEESSAESLEDEEDQNKKEVKEYLLYEELKVQDIEDTVIYVDRPVYVPYDSTSSSTDYKKVSGYDASVESLKKAVVKPENYKNGTFFYQYNENLVYEVYAQPYHLTDIILQSGEVVIGTPLLSEDENVWELTAGVAKDSTTGQDIQHLFVKPAYSKLDSSLIIITDRRVYHFRLKSYSDTHMAMVKFTYPEYKNQWAKKDNTDGKTYENNLIRTSNPAFISTDYKIKYSAFKKPEFLPKIVYDDGQMTYIQVDEIVLQKKLPLIFNEKNEIQNYTVDKNLFVIPRLVNKVTLRLGRQKVIIEKKKTKETTENNQNNVNEYPENMKR